MPSQRFVARDGVHPFKMQTNAIAYWLIPAEAEHELFREIIRILAKQLDAPRFEPHLTICVTQQDARSARETLKQIAAAPIRLRARSVHCSNLFTKTLFARFQRNRALDNLNSAVRRAAGVPAAILRDPHVSLVYKEMPMSAKKQLASTIELPLDKVVFDSIKAIRGLSPMRSGAEIKLWRVVATKSLSG